MILQPGYWVVLLNDMRSANFENVQPVACAETREMLEQFVEGQRVETYINDDGHRRWHKAFRKDGPLEWFNSPYDNHFVQWWPQDPPDIPHCREFQ